MDVNAKLAILEEFAFVTFNDEEPKQQEVKGRIKDTKSSETQTEHFSSSPSHKPAYLSNTRNKKQDKIPKLFRKLFSEA